MLTIRKIDLERIYDACDRAYPNEACGILGGHGSMVETVIPMTNAHPSPHYYEMNPEEQFQVMKDMREAGLEMVGIYHSHTGGPAYPSMVDVERAYWPGTALPNYPEARYLIVTLLDRKKPAARVFTIAEKQVVEEGLLITSEEKSR
jgi:[CysO sulfur-carrier protein]-S-L-cysteine hydrolase